MIRAVVGLGANVGDRLAALRDAVAALRRVMRVERLSRVYETAPVGGPPQPDFLNAAALVAYEGGAEDLLDALQAIELQLGRVRMERWGPRPIDLDILLIEGLALETDRLVVPHPRLTQRAFALRPLADVAPDALDLESGRPYALLAEGHTGVRLTDLQLYVS
jgi:2-amino-4-hydroxy-6-hydroxymethyldihydropteridine diphosphokinase